MKIRDFLELLIQRKASDLHLSAGLPPMLRIDGDLFKVGEEPLEDAYLRAQLDTIMTDSQRKIFHEKWECDFSTEIESRYRFRVNAFEQSRGVAVAIRGIPLKIPTLKDFDVPPLFID